MATLRELGSAPFAVVPAGERPVTAPADRWAVLVGADGPVSALGPGTTLGRDERPPGILIAAADMNLAEAFDSEVFRQLTEVSALVLVEPDDREAGAPRIAGVVSRVVLARAILRGAERGFTESMLAGVPAVPLISRSCGYLEGKKACATPVSFPRRPFDMPQCPNERGLAAHRFSW